MAVEKNRPEYIDQKKPHPAQSTLQPCGNKDVPYKSAAPTPNKNVK